MGLLMDDELSNESKNYSLEDFYKIMDAILTSMCKKPDEIPLSPDVIAKKAGLNIEKPIAFMLCAKMSREGLLQKMESGINYCLRAEALFFEKSGGYMKQFISENAENTRLEKLESGQKLHRKWMTWLTAILAVVGLISAVYYLVELYWNYGWFH
ncbi:MAG: hypothetical protein U0U70_10770 [Chitinophagaceae bacterium]